MTKIWAKIVINHSVKKSIIHYCNERLDVFNFYENVRQICEKLRVPTPIILDIYAQNFLEFNIFKFKQRDFLEDIAFDFLVLENGE